MALFGKLFEKKECDICGGEIGLLGNRKLSDGNLCKNCAAKLSPFMTDRRTSSVEEIRQHLNYREQNEQAVARFHPTRTLGGNTKVYIDQAAGTFAVSSRSNWREANPDIIPLSQVIACDIDEKESRTEVYQKDSEGKDVSYNPPRYHYSYRFDVTIRVDSPYFDEIRFDLTNERPDNRYSESYRRCEAMAQELRQALLPSQYPAQGQPVYGAQNVAAQGQYGAQPQYGYAQTAAQGAVGAYAAQHFAQPQAAPAQDGRWQCTCGAINTGKFCAECGQPRPVAVFRCPQCGWTPDPGAALPKFCPNCGNRLG